ncbi:hypothetical protein D5F01_LYC19152 [Larimichthys crocea]|uniref:LINE-1 type transposase domain-containing protein 1 n=1 Tax=Larimichthys crocea TaxID=215358 RepID=A0A6G0HRC2_LARCR|nr:hypothetical protein D5F01_LYC19152 [Larimichthys crocea]
MPRKKNQTDDAEHTQQAGGAHAGASLLALREAVTEITANISKVIDEKLSPLSELFKIHREELDRHDKRITEAEQRISALEDATDLVDGKIEALEKMVCELSERADDLENRGRRKNIRIVGLPEEAEGDDPTRFFETWLPQLLHIETKSGRVKLERAHRSLAPKPPTTQRPRPVLVRFHNYQDKQHVMNAAWEVGRKNQALKHEDATVMIFQDFSASVLRRRKGYDAVKKQLRALGTDYRLIYPASLRVTCHGSTKVFHVPAAVEKYAQSLKETLREDV